jgi:carboxymethylenebutenolidase
MGIFGLHEYIKEAPRQPRRVRGSAGLSFPQGHRSHQDHRYLAATIDRDSKPDAELLSDLDSTVAWAKSQGGDTSRLGIIGFCRGGRTV